VSDPETLQVYAARAQEYAELTDDFNASDPGLDAFIAAVVPAGRVLDLGCGPGASAARMAKAGLRVDAFDPVAEMVALASRHPGVTVRQAGFDDLDDTGIYDGIWANFSLLHAPRADMPRHLAGIRRALRPGGRFHIALKTGTGEGRDALGRHYTYYMEDELRGLLAETGFTVTGKYEGCDKGLSGKAEPWIALAAHA
jgi:SAM-dependent methyltransferase